MEEKLLLTKRKTKKGKEEWFLKIIDTIPNDEFSGLYNALRSTFKSIFYNGLLKGFYIFNEKNPDEKLKELFRSYDDQPAKIDVKPTSETWRTILDRYSKRKTKTVSKNSHDVDVILDNIIEVSGYRYNSMTGETDADIDFDKIPAFCEDVKKEVKNGDVKLKFTKENEFSLYYHSNEFYTLYVGDREKKKKQIEESKIAHANKTGNEGPVFFLNTELRSGDELLLETPEGKEVKCFIDKTFEKAINVDCYYDNGRQEEVTLFKESDSEFKSEDGTKLKKVLFFTYNFDHPRPKVEESFIIQLETSLKLMYPKVDKFQYGANVVNIEIAGDILEVVDNGGHFKIYQSTPYDYAKVDKVDNTVVDLALKVADVIISFHNNFKKLKTELKVPSVKIIEGDRVKVNALDELANEIQFTGKVIAIGGPNNDFYTVKIDQDGYYDGNILSTNKSNLEKLSENKPSSDSGKLYIDAAIIGFLHEKYNNVFLDELGRTNANIDGRNVPIFKEDTISYTGDFVTGVKKPYELSLSSSNKNIQGEEDLVAIDGIYQPSSVIVGYAIDHSQDETYRYNNILGWDKGFQSKRQYDINHNWIKENMSPDKKGILTESEKDLRKQVAAEKQSEAIAEYERVQAKNELNKSETIAKIDSMLVPSKEYSFSDGQTGVYIDSQDFGGIKYYKFDITSDSSSASMRVPWSDELFWSGIKPLEIKGPENIEEELSKKEDVIESIEAEVAPKGPELDQKTPITIEFNYYKGVDYPYSNNFELNKAIEEFLQVYGNDRLDDNQKAFISKYEGYGGLEKYGAKGKSLLFEYYTPDALIKKMWGLAYKYGFQNGKILEPSVGTGRFLNYVDFNLNKVVAYEVQPYNSKITKKLFPAVDLREESFSQHFYGKGRMKNTATTDYEKEFDLVIGNPPYGDFSDTRSDAERKRLKAGAIKFEHYFILRGLDVLKSGGLLVFVSTANLFLKDYDKAKDQILNRADLVDAYLLPSTTFSKTKVNTSLIVLKKK